MDDSNDTLKIKFQRLHSDVVGLDLSSVIDRLFSEFVLSVDNLLDLKYITNPRQRTEQLLVTLHRSGHPSAFVKLRQAIASEPAYSFVVDKLDQLTVEGAGKPARWGAVRVGPRRLQGVEARGGGVAVDRRPSDELGLDEVDGRVDALERRGRPTSVPSGTTSGSAEMLLENRAFPPDRSLSEPCKYCGGAGGSESGGKPFPVTDATGLERLLPANNLDVSGHSVRPQGHVACTRPKPIASLPTGKPVFGICCSDDRIYVVRQRCPEIEIYSSTDLRLVSCCPIKGLRNPNDIVCWTLDADRHLFVLDCIRPSSLVYRVPLVDVGSATSSLSSFVDSWSAGEDLLAIKLSVTQSGTLLVVYHASKKLREFTSDGRLVFDVDLGPDIISPWHAVGLPPAAFRTPSYVVCHGDVTDQLHRVCLVEVLNSDGRSFAVTRRTYGAEKGRADRGLLSVPSHLAVSSDLGLIFATDVNNGRIAVLDFSLQNVRDIAVTAAAAAADGRGDGGAPVCPHPVRLCLDERNRRLYVACSQRSAGRYVTGNVTVFTLS